MPGLPEIPHGPAPATPDAVVGHLRAQGCVIVDTLLPGPDLARLVTGLEALVADAALGDNDFDGYATRRVFDPFACTRLLDDVALQPVVAAAVDALIGPAQFGMTIVSQVQPGEVRQRLHRDSSLYPLPAGFGPVQLNAIWALDDFTADNGATVVAPRSHLDGPGAAARESSALVPAVMAAGSVLLYDGRLLHGAGANGTGSPRLAVIIEHTVRWLRPAENHPLAVPPALVAQLPTPLQELLGYNRHSSFLGLVAGRPPAQWLHERHGAGADHSKGTAP